jgi:hypothetical protein
MTAPTKFAQVLGAMQAALQAAAPVSPNVFRARARVVPQQMATAIVVRPAQAERDASVGQGAKALWLTAVAMDCYARGSAANPVDVVVDDLMGAAVQRLMQDPSLGGVVGFIDPQAVSWDFDVDGEQTACATVTFYVRHATAAASFF